MKEFKEKNVHGRGNDIFHTESCCAHNHSHEHAEHLHEGRSFGNMSHSDDEFCNAEIGCSCGHSHGHGGENSGKGRKEIIKLAIGSIFFAAGFFADGNIKLALFLISYIVLGFGVLVNAVKNLFSGKVFDENFLMSIATVGALIIGEYPEAAGVMLFYCIGEMFQDYAVSRSEKSINAVMDIRPDYAYILKDKERVRVDAESVEVGQIIVVSPGERIPLDGIVTDGSTFLDTSCLTGESTPRRVRRGDEVLGGAVNTTGVIYVKTTRGYGESAASRIIEVMRNSLDKKAKSEKFITAFAKRYTPAVVLLAVVVAIVIPFFDGFDFAKWVYRALIFLVVSCPCALVVSVPLGFFAGLGSASKKGVVIKGGNVLELLSKADTAFFDKTGTLTEGVFEVTDIKSADSQRFLKMCAYAEFYSNHPIAGAVKASFGEKIDEAEISDYKEIAGKGISVKVFGKNILAGNEKLLKDNGIDVPESDSIGTLVYMAADGEYMGYLTVSDKIRNTDGISRLKELGLNTVMLTGDISSAAVKTAQRIGISEVHSELLPQDKSAIVEERSKTNTCIFTGDGINDAPVLAVSDVGIAMGGIGSDAAIEAADAVLMNDDLSKIADAISISRKTMRIIRQNIVFSIGIKILVMLLSIAGISTMWLAIFADVGVALLAVLNSVRALRA